MINEKWISLDAKKTRKFIDEVISEAYIDLFNAENYELWAYELPFFDGYSRYSLNNTSMLPFFSLDYISNGENHYYLDGSAHPITLLIARGAVSLTADNVLSYLDFFDDVVFDPQRTVKFIVDAYDTAHHGPSAAKHHFNAITFTTQSGVEEKSDHFLLTLPAVVNDETINALVRVGRNGHIDLLAPTPAALTGASHTHDAPLRYEHPDAAAILNLIRQELENSAEGLRLCRTLENWQAHVHVLAGIGLGAFAPSAHRAYITAPRPVAGYSHYQALALGAALRDMELQLLGESRGTHSRTDPLARNSFAESNCAMNLDIWINLCIIVDEIENAGSSGIMGTFRSYGFERIYTAYKNQAPMEELARIAADLMRLQIKED